MLSEQACKYDDMAEFMKRMIIERTNDLTKDERNILGVASKNIFSVYRTGIRTVIDYENEKKKLILFIYHIFWNIKI